VRRVAEAEPGEQTSNELAAALHDQLARAWEAAVLEAVAATGVRQVVVSGGVFCNQRLSDRLTARLQGHGLAVLRHEQVPPGDGGLSLGQAAIARARLAPRCGDAATNDDNKDKMEHPPCV
jgi:hydrogenase maturation protein HypF